MHLYPIDWNQLQSPRKPQLDRFVLAPPPTPPQATSPQPTIDDTSRLSAQHRHNRPQHSLHNSLTKLLSAMSSFPADSHAPTPPILPPKPSSQEPSRIGTPASGAAPPPPPSTLSEAGQQYRSSVIAGLDAAATAAGGGVPMPPPPPAVAARSADIPDPGDQWLPQVLQDKS